MRTNKMILVAAASLAVQSLQVQTCAAQEPLRAQVFALGISTNSMGQFVYHPLNNKAIISNCASEIGVTNLSDLRLVYDRSADAVQVVDTNGTVLCTPMTFAGGVTLSNTNGTRVHRLSYVYWETNTVANGTLSASEYSFSFSSLSNHPSFFLLRGQLQFAVAGEGTNSPTIYNGSILVGPPFFAHDFGGSGPGIGMNTSRHGR